MTQTPIGISTKHSLNATSQNEKEKKQQYNERVLEIDHRSFTIFRDLWTLNFSRLLFSAKVPENGEIVKISTRENFYVSRIEVPVAADISQNETAKSSGKTNSRVEKVIELNFR